jgi:hypothetical protein
VSDVAGNSTPNTYTLTIPACALNCNTNQLPEAVAHDVTVIAANVGGMAQASMKTVPMIPRVTRSPSPKRRLALIRWALTASS